MNKWVILTKEIDGVETIVRGGLNVIVDDAYTRIIITDELHARQIDKLEIVDGQIKVKEGMKLESLESMNTINGIIAPSFSLSAEGELVDGN